MLSENREVKHEGKIKSHKRLTYDILDGMVDWVRVIDENGMIIYANKTMEKCLGKKIVGEKCYEVLGKNRPCKTCITKKTIKAGVGQKKEEYVNGKIFSVKSSPVRDVNGNIYAAVEVFRDVTRERKLEQQLLKKNEKMSKDLEFARALQKKILPTKGRYGSIEIDYLYRPSEMLSGDMFDVFNIDGEHTGIYISDVVGHGVTASMMTMFVRQTMRSIKSEILSPAEAISELHKRFLDLHLDDDKYFTIFYGVMNRRYNTFTYVNGGHNSVPIVLNNEGLKLLESRGYPVCSLFEKIEYQESTIKLEKGDKVLFYTDGIVEAKNSKEEQFGLDRLLDIIKKEGKNTNLINLIENEIDGFNFGYQEDDYAVIKMKVLE
ncbi:SpoIIE family protein phosphatase [Caldisalinibacter kiritimatiensis]|uniref:Serine phosphatase RsbU, regulator of sigma subunit n=1 Tax=Caldisalinibacter kiritimatiensis TaxID=1304284 RepID=R1CA65_9FIRM|nr:SpoIIE family protein phosphatase [Caldisalinibacter kiritimatiensis]EOC99234.1 Serine phosphatase RsbU, regulator of sigma subunit [Caldisalinibacter kiritimatiensis]